MITYKPFWETLKKSPETTYTLIHKHQISSATIDRLRKNRPLSTSTINDLCIILGCSPENILAFTPPSPETKENDIFVQGNNSQSPYGIVSPAVLYLIRSAFLFQSIEI